MFSPFFPPALWQMALSLVVFLAVWWLARRSAWAWQVNLALLLIAATPLVVAFGWRSWFYDTMGRAGYTGLVEPERLVELQLATVFHAMVLSGTMFFLFLVRGLIVLRQRAMAGTLAEGGHEC
ncbi:MAG: hypothetical protein BGO12_21790 [Verrucomicrobia bacterium 61-8]|nr:hypothetical protein [Verrucomicrobiota bacterium]OJV15379.1 MAG: hypothetical protein BGO12_21790 [Verrucomicrobia bacterium 61-8]